MKRTLYFFISIIILINNFLFGQNPIKIACIGNSVTYGYGLADPAIQSYPALLQKKMGNSYLVKNFGHSGATLLRKGHNPYYKTKAFADALNFKADIAVLHLGLNDTDPRNFPNYRDDFIPDYNWLIDTLKKSNPEMKIYVCQLTPIFTGHSRFLSSTFTWYHELQQSISRAAAVNKTPVINFYSALHNRPDLFTDVPTLHPNEAGAAKIAEVVYQHIIGNFGGLQIPNVFNNNMVLQRDKPITIWGKANAGTLVSVSFTNITKKMLVDAEGNWVVRFPAMKANTIPQKMVIINNGRQIIFSNILVGDVWLASGQSNMYFSLAQTKSGDSLAGIATKQKNIRLLKYRPYAETDNTAWDSAALKKANDLDFFSGIWKMNEMSAAKEFSGVAYAFAAKIQKEINVPVGIIEIAVGGSPQISWVSRLALESDPLFEPAFKNWRSSDYIMQWCRERANTNLKSASFSFQRHTYEPSYNFEAGIEKIVPFTIKGIIWYQGESDAENAELYKKLFPVFVKDWRNQWKENLPFYFVQLSSIERPSWNYFRDIQRQLLNEIPNSGMAVTTDLGDRTDVHYKDKIPVGNRLAILALKNTYHRKIVSEGPLLDTILINKNTAVISFTNADGLKAANGTALDGFEIIDNKGLFHRSAAIIQNNKILLRLPENIVVKKIVYGWEPFTRANLVNAAQLPASTFLYELK